MSPNSANPGGNTSSGDSRKSLPVDASLFPTDRYRPIKALGQGALGVVYLCTDIHLMKRVAVKCLHVGTADHVMSFQQEAIILSRLNHDNIIKVLDFGTSQSGQPYMVMEDFTGQSLQEIIEERGKLPISSATEVFLQICSALIYLHRHNVYHRDLKPSNILVQFSDSGMPWVKLIDFGLSKVSVQDRAGIEVQGRTIVGTPAYMSPDQVEGNVFDATSEIYSLGCVLHEMFSGQPPFSGETALEILNKHINEVPPLLTDSTPEAPQVISRIIDKCLQKERKKRFQSVSEIVEVWNEGQPTGTTDATNASSPSTGNRLRWKVVLPAFALVAGLVGAAVAIVFQPTTDPNAIGKTIRYETLPSSKFIEVFPKLDSPSEADEDKSEQKQESLYIGQSPDVLDDMTLSSNKIIDSKADDRESLTLRYGVDEDGIKKLAHRKSLRHLDISQASVTDSVFEDLAVLPNLKRLVLNRTGVSTLAGIEKLTGLERLDLKNTAITNDSLTRLKALKKLEELNLTATSISDAGVRNLTALPSLRSLSLSATLVTPAVADELIKLPLVRISLARTDVDETTIRKIAEMRSLQYLDIDDCKAISNVSNLEREFPTISFEPRISFLQKVLEDGYREIPTNRKHAMAKFEYARDLLDARFGKNSYYSIPVQLQIVSLTLADGQFQKAKQSLDRILPLVEHGGKREELLFALDLSSLISNRLDPSKCVPITLRSIKVAEELHRPQSDIASRYYTLGDYYLRAKRFKDSESALRKSISIYEKSDRKGSPFLGHAFVHLAECLRESNHHEQAMQNYQKGLAIFRDTNTEKAAMGEAYLGIAELELQHKKFSEALKINGEALRCFQLKKNLPDSTLRVAYLQRSRIFNGLGRKTDAKIQAALSQHFKQDEQSAKN